MKKTSHTSNDHFLGLMVRWLKPSIFFLLIAFLSFIFVFHGKFLKRKYPTSGVLMTRDEFTELRRAPKEISADIQFRPTKKFGDGWLFVEDMPVGNQLNYDLFLDGRYNSITKTLIFNFKIRGVGPICRMEVNGKIHRDAGRTHKHDLIHESDSRKNLPNAQHRPDLENKTPREVWEILCRQAKIEHTGNFVDPT
jgi:hypothetical protein